MRHAPRRSAAVIITGNAMALVLLAAIFSPVVLAKNELVILPDAQELPKNEGSHIGLTCLPQVEDESLVGPIEWFDPNNNKIENTNQNSPIYVQPTPAERGVVLSFTKLAEQQAGTYTCAASYASSERLSDSITIKSIVPTTFQDAPVNQYTKVGEDYKIRCKVVGSGKHSVQWARNNVDLTSNQKYIIDNSGLLIKGVTEADDGVFTCSVLDLDNGDMMKRDIKLEVQVPPVIQPMEEVSVTEGRTASVQCTATGKPPPSYKWIQDKTNKDLSKEDRFSVNPTNGLLIMNRVEYNDNGNYTCEAKNDAATVEQKVKINVLVSPKIDRPQRQLNVTAEVGSQATMVCLARGRPPPRVTFRKLSMKEAFSYNTNNDKYLLLQAFNEDDGYNNATLTIFNLNRTDDGLYQCIASNEAGDAYEMGHLTVEFAPTFEKTRDLPPVYVWNQKPGNLTCTPEAIPNATIAWKFQGREIDNNTNPQVFQIYGRAQQSFLIVNAGDQRQYFTRYECVATNKVGQDTLYIALEKGEVPRQVQQVTIQSVTATTVKFGIVPPQNLRGLPLRSITVQYRNIRDPLWSQEHTWALEAPYILENLQPEAEYVFRFAATNDVGRGAWNREVSQLMPRRSVPAEPKILTPTGPSGVDNSVTRQEVMDVSPYSDRYELRWGIPNDSGDPITRYEIRYCETEKVDGEWRVLDTCSGTIEQSFQHTSYVMSNLKPDTTYKVELRAHNAIGDSTPAEVRIRTARGMDQHITREERTAISSGTIVGIVVAAVLLVLAVVDVICFCVARAGLLAILCARAKSQDEDESKLGREEKEPLRSQQPEQQDRGNTYVEFDGRQVYAKKGEIIGKHSAV